MKRTTVMLPPELKEKASRLAREKGISLGELLRESLTAALEVDGDRQRTDPLLSDGAVYKGEAPEDLSEHHDRYLYDK